MTFAFRLHRCGWLLLGGLFAVHAHAQQQLQPAQSEIVFVSKQMGVPVEGRFKTFDAQIRFDPAKPAAGQVNFNIDMASASLGHKETDAELVKPDWFHTAKFAKATFQSTAIKPTAPGKLEITGKLQIKGVSQDVVVPVNLSQTGGLTTATGTFVLKRLPFKIGDNEWSDTSMVADDVQVRFKLALSGVAKF